LLERDGSADALNRNLDSTTSTQINEEMEAGQRAGLCWMPWNRWSGPAVEASPGLLMMRRFGRLMQGAEIFVFRASDLDGSCDFND